MGLNVDRALNNIENTLSDVSLYPVVGTLAGCSKILIGVVQTLSAIAYGILTFIPSAISSDWTPLKHSWTHIKHGVGNMAAGTVEAIPIVQSALYGIRQLRQAGGSDIQVKLYTGHECKFMAYASLEERDWSFIGADDEAVNRVKQIFKEKIQQNGGDQNTSAERKMAFAKDSIREWVGR